MTNLERYNLWQNTELMKLNSHITLVRNNISGFIMIKNISSKDSYPLIKSLCDIRHKNLMTVYDAMIEGENCISLCEYIEGSTLERAVEDFCPYGEKQVKDIMCQLCDGLTVLHQKKFIHRDINPSNVMIDKNGIVKIIDFDIIRTVKENQRKDTRVLGTVGYASPEQFGFYQTNERADIYSCGVLMNYLLTGKLPDENLYIGRLNPIIKKCIEIDENNRFSSAQELKFSILGQDRYRADTPMQTVKNFPGKLPGFRSNTRYKKVIAVIAYIYYFLALFSFIASISIGQSIGIGFTLTGNILYVVVIFIFWSLLPYICFFDIFNISRIFKNYSPSSRKNILKTFGVISFIIGFVILLIAQSLNIIIK